MEVPGPDSDWRSPQFRQKVVAQIEEAMRKAGTANTTHKSSTDMENHVYVKAKTREEYLSLVARLIIHFRDIHKKALGGPVGGPGQMPMQQMVQQAQQVQQQNQPPELLGAVVGLQTPELRGRMGPVELLHMSVYSQAFSPCGRFLAAGNNYGEIALFSLSAALSPDASAVNQKPVLTFTAHEAPVFCLLSTDSQLLSAGNGEVSAWSWSELVKKNAKPLWTRRPNYRSSLEIPEINSMTINPRDNTLVVGGGDNNIHILDLEHGVFKAVLQGHTDYVHCVSVREREGEILSGGEDGAVRVWDSRTCQSVHCIEVYKYESCARPQCGKWIGCVTTDSDWLLCGGGPSLSLWHLRSLSPTSVFPLSGCQRQAAFYQDMILAVGDGALVSHCLLGGEVKAQIPCTPPSLNTLQLNTNSTEHRVLTVGGSSRHIDVFTNMSYKAFSLSF